MTTTYELWKSGSLDYLIKKGLINTTIVFYCELYKEYLFQIDLGKSKSDAIQEVVEKMCVTERTVQRAIARAIK